MDKKTSAISIFLLSFLILSINYITKLNFSLMISLVLGSIFYLLYIKISNLDNSHDFDYFQNGDFSIISLFTLSLLFFKFKNLHFTILLVIISFFFYQLFYKKVLISSKKKDMYTGFLLNLIFLGFLFISYNKNLITSLDKVQEAWKNTFFDHHKPFYSILAIIAIILLIIQFKIKHKLSLFSAGKNYFQETNYNYNKFSLILIFLKSIFGVLTILLLTFYGGVFYYFPKKNNPWNDLFLFSLIIIYSQTLFLLSTFINYQYILLTSILFSYILSFKNIRSKGKIYD